MTTRTTDNLAPTPRQHRTLELLLVLLVVSISMLMWRHSINDPILLHLYYIPAVLTGFYLGGYRARLIALLCVVTGFILFLPNVAGSASEGIPLLTLLAFLLWSATLFMVAMLIGTLSDGLRKVMRDKESSLMKEALTDSLTGIANRRCFDLELARHLEHAQGSPSGLALILVDIDFFKNFNDRYGHQTGDQILKQVAHVFQRVIRSNDLLARYGGEEFAVVLPEITQTDALAIAERMRALIEQNRFDHHGLIHRLTVSIGIAEALPNESAKAFCERVDAALYSSKESGRNSVHFHDGTECISHGLGFKSTVVDQRESNEISESGNSFNDQLTGLPTQVVFVEELRRRVLEKHRYGGVLSLALIASDGNPNSAGSDRKIRKSFAATSARLIQSAVRDSDFVANWSEGVFSVLLPSTSIEQAQVPLRRLCTSAIAHDEPQYPSLTYSFSVGIVEINRDEAFGEVVERAKETLELAREQGPASLAIHQKGKASVVDGPEVAATLSECDSYQI